MPYSDINRVVLVGRLTRDPELRSLPSGHTVCNLRLACNGFRKDGETYQERPNFFERLRLRGARGEHRPLHPQGLARGRGRAPGVARVGDRRAE